jgi:hypothetical protein
VLLVQNVNMIDINTLKPHILITPQGKLGVGIVAFNLIKIVTNYE